MKLFIRTLTKYQTEKILINLNKIHNFRLYVLNKLQPLCAAFYSILNSTY